MSAAYILALGVVVFCVFVLSVLPNVVKIRRETKIIKVQRLEIEQCCKHQGDLPSISELIHQPATSKNVQALVAHGRQLREKLT